MAFVQYVVLNFKNVLILKMDKIERKLNYEREREFIKIWRRAPHNKEKIDRLYKQRAFCNVCNTYILKYNFKKHKKTFKHVSKENEINSN